MDDIRRLDPEQLQALGLGEVLDGDDTNPVIIDGVQRNRLAYTFAEFINQGFGSETPITANTECVTGSYARYVLGHDEQRGTWLMLISQPYSREEIESDASASLEYRINDKSAGYSVLLDELCYDMVDFGWVSLANWGKLDPTVSGNVLRFTNANFSEAGRITFAGEYLDTNSETQQFLNLVSTQQIIQDASIQRSSIIGPNFPIAEYDEGRHQNLARLSQSTWDLDGNTDLLYYQHAVAREQLEFTFSNGTLFNETARFGYVLDCLGRLYFADPQVSSPSQPLGGGAAAAVGRMLTDENGLVRYITAERTTYTNSSDTQMNQILDQVVSSIRVNPTYSAYAFETPFTTGTGVFQKRIAWNCRTDQMQVQYTPVEERASNFPNVSGARDPARRTLIAGSIASTATPDPNSWIEVLFILDGVAKTPLFYDPDPNPDVSQYVLRPGQTIDGQAITTTLKVIYTKVRMEVKNTDDRDGEAILELNNCNPSDDTRNLGVLSVSELPSVYNLYPNPAQHSINLELTQNARNNGSSLKLEIVTIGGQSLFSQTLSAPLTKNYKIRLDDWKSGAYILKLSNGLEEESITFMVQD